MSHPAGSKVARTLDVTLRAERENQVVNSFLAPTTRSARDAARVRGRPGVEPTFRVIQDSIRSYRTLYTLLARYPNAMIPVTGNHDVHI